MSNVDRQRLIDSRNLHGYSQKFVAVSIGVAAATVSQWESGAKNPSRESIGKLADLYGVTIDYLLGRESSENEIKPVGNSDRLDESLVNLLMDLPQKDVQRVRDFVAGLKAAHKD